MVDMKSQITDYLRDLHLPTIRRLYEDHAEKAAQESLAYEMYLCELLERECEVRRHKKTERLLKESRLPLEKTLDSFDMKRLPRKLAQVVKSLLDGSFLERKENILSFGNPGSGKTHLLSAIGQELIRRMGKRVYFTQCSLLVQELLIAKKELKLARILKRFSRFDAIIIDDIGYVQQNREEMEVLFTLLAERYERGSIMLTSNLPFSKWEKIFKDPMVTAAAIDRLVHHCVVLELNVPSYRMEKAKKTKKEKGG